MMTLEDMGQHVLARERHREVSQSWTAAIALLAAGRGSVQYDDIVVMVMMVK